MPHAVSRLRAACLAHDSHRPRLDRGAPRTERCTRCRLPPSHCLCAWQPARPSRAAVCLVMAEFEPLKPSNTGWLVADVLPDTRAFRWSRLAVDPALPALLADPRWQACVVFPGEFADPRRVVTHWPPASDEPATAPALPHDAHRAPTARRPLFVLLDGTWSEARKMFRKSPWLDALPVLSLAPDQASRYRLRRSIHAHHLCTAEVAALCLAMAGEAPAAQMLQAWLDVFGNRYLQARQSVPADAHDAAHGRLRALGCAPVPAGAD